MPRRQRRWHSWQTPVISIREALACLDCRFNAYMLSVVYFNPRGTCVPRRPQGRKGNECISFQSARHLRASTYLALFGHIRSWISIREALACLDNMLRIAKDYIDISIREALACLDPTILCKLPIDKAFQSARHLRASTEFYGSNNIDDIISIREALACLDNICCDVVTPIFPISIREALACLDVLIR